VNEILTSQPGEVAVINSDQFMPTVIRFQGFRPLRAVITRVGYSQSALANFMATLQNVIYVYTIGDDIGNLSISGYAFSSVCNLAGVSHGISDVFREYDRMKLTKSNSTVVVTIGDKSLIGLLVGITIQSESPEFGLITYSLAIKVIPEETHLRKSVTQTADAGNDEPPVREEEKPPAKETDDAEGHVSGGKDDVVVITTPSQLEAMETALAQENLYASTAGKPHIEMGFYDEDTSGPSIHDVGLVNRPTLPNYGAIASSATSFAS
jgi:hypothetical protein